MRVVRELIDHLRARGRLSPAELEALAVKGHLSLEEAEAARAAEEARADAADGADAIAAALERGRAPKRRRARRGVDAAGLRALEAALASARAAEAEALEGFARLSRALGPGRSAEAGGLDAALERLEAAPDAALTGALRRVVAAGPSGLSSAARAATCLYHRLSARGAAFRAFAAQAALGPGGPASRYGWALRSAEAARARRVAAQQERLAAGFGRLLRAEPDALDRPLRPYDAAAFFFLSAALTPARRAPGAARPRRCARAAPADAPPPPLARAPALLRLAARAEPRGWRTALAPPDPRDAEAWRAPPTLAALARGGRGLTEAAYAAAAPEMWRALETLRDWDVARPRLGGDAAM